MMRLLELTELQFDNYAKFHSKRSYFQTLEYAKMYEKKGYKKIFLGLMDENNIYGATLLLTKNIFLNFSFAYAPKGFLVDFDDMELLTTFTELLKVYAKKNRIAYITLYPNVLYKKFDKDNNLIYYNNNLLKNIKSLGYIHSGFYNQFKNNHSRYEVVLNIEETKSVNNLFNTFNRTTKRNIKNGSIMGISVIKGTQDDINIFYNMIQKKVKNDINYYKNFFEFFNSKNNMIELYFAKLNPRIYLDNYTYLLNKASEENDRLNKLLIAKKGKSSNKQLYKKIQSDKLLEKYKKQISRATALLKKYPDGIYLSCCAIIKNNQEIYFMIDGYEEKYKYIYTTSLLKWEIIKKYIKEGYKQFNLGEIAGIFTPNNKFYRHYLAKVGFNGEVIEHPGEFYLVTNQLVYNAYKNMYIKIKSKETDSTKANENKKEKKGIFPFFDKNKD